MENIITGDTLIADVLQMKPQSKDVLIKYGMHCFGCALAHHETVKQAVAAHGEDLTKLIEELNNL